MKPIYFFFSICGKDFSFAEDEESLSREKNFTIMRIYGSLGVLGDEAAAYVALQHNVYACEPRQQRNNDIVYTYILCVLGSSFFLFFYQI